MKRFVEGTHREQSTLFPECLEDWIQQVGECSIGKCAVVSTCAMVVSPQSISCARQDGALAEEVDNPTDDSYEQQNDYCSNDKPNK